MVTTPMGNGVLRIAARSDPTRSLVTARGLLRQRRAGSNATRFRRADVALRGRTIRPVRGLVRLRSDIERQSVDCPSRRSRAFSHRAESRRIHQRREQEFILRNYSPDLNPIETAFSKLRALLKKGAARTVDNLRQVIADALTHLTAHEHRRPGGIGPILWWLSCHAWLRADRMTPLLQRLRL
jgi:hypothetical protein